MLNFRSFTCTLQGILLVSNNYFFYTTMYQNDLINSDIFFHHFRKMNRSFRHRPCLAPNEGSEADLDNITLCSNITQIKINTDNKSYMDIDPLTWVLIILMSAISLFGFFGNAILLSRLLKRMKLDLRVRFIIGTRGLSTRTSRR